MKSSSLKYAHWAFRFCLALGLAVGLSYVWAAAPTQAANPPGGAMAKPAAAKPAAVAQAQPGPGDEKKHTQQERMKSCNAEAKAKTLKGDERKAFMSQCLSNKPEPPVKK